MSPHRDCDYQGSGCGDPAPGSIEIVTIQTGIGMGIGTDIGTAHAETWTAMGAGIAMMTEAAETMTEAMTPG